jgi:protein-S-isoprenylcysteine O-methyltransferase Ste14
MDRAEQAAGERRVSTGALVRKTIIGVAIVVALIFVPAGRLDWIAGWAFLGCFLAFVAVAAGWMLVRDPGLLAERNRPVAEAGTPHDRIVIALVVLAELAVIIVCGLDVRFGWSGLPLAVQIAAWAALFPAMALPTWVLISNPYASHVERVQAERGHTVVEHGAYRSVRHPMYAGVVLVGLLLPLALGSRIALIPGVLFSALFIYRTAHEDRMLQRSLAGYAEYARTVRFRLFPGIW